MVRGFLLQADHDAFIAAYAASNILQQQQRKVSVI
jgi:hypothetical protein